ncbi:MAG: hypothetical protein LBH43_04550 [Treponema sp.]|jgi:hypothetical protein|nr:hypothetical protein [Treponema sp.]
MNLCPLCDNSAVPNEYRKIAGELFPADDFPSNAGNCIKAAEDYANALGIGADYRRFLNTDRRSGEMGGFLANFQLNLNLLIQKTWVEQADEARKGKLQDDVPGFMAGIKQGNYKQALEEFGVILEELAYLFFGAQSSSDDFTEYTFRIDEQIGLFWWYGCRLSNLKETGKGGAVDDECLWAILLVGICYLTNF